MSWIIFWLVCAGVSAAIASSKGRSVFGWFLLGCLISIFAVILVAVLPSKKKAPVIVGGEVATAATHIHCPKCMGLVNKKAAVCMHCRSPLDGTSATPGQAPCRNCGVRFPPVNGVCPQCGKQA